MQRLLVANGGIVSLRRLRMGIDEESRQFCEPYDGITRLRKDIGTALGEVQKKAAAEAASLRREIDGLRSEVAALRASRAPQKTSHVNRAPFALIDVYDDPSASGIEAVLKEFKDPLRHPAEGRLGTFRDR